MPINDPLPVRHFRLPGDLWAEITRLAARKRTTRTAVVVEALRIGLNKPARRTAPILRPPAARKPKSPAGAPSAAN